MKEGREFKVSQNAAEDEILSNSIDSFMESIGPELEEEVKRVIENEEMIGEGRTAKVFNLENTSRSPCKLCAKIWKNKPKRELSAVEYRKIQFHSPEEEFDMQDELYRAGCKVSRPIVYLKIADRDIMVMERIVGYDLEKIKEAGAHVQSSAWQELMKAATEIKNNHVVHRDIKPGNIVLETSEDLFDGAVLGGKIKIIDFGLSKRILGSTVSPEDFAEQIGGDTIRYPEDLRKIEDMQPRRPDSPFGISNKAS